MGSTSLDRGIDTGIAVDSYFQDRWDRTRRCQGLLSTGNKMFYVMRSSTGLTVRVITDFDNGTLGSSYNGTSSTTSNITLSSVVAGSLAISVAVGADNSLYVAYASSDTQIKVAKLTLSGSTYSKAWEENAMAAGSGWLFGLVDIDVSESGSGTSLAIVANRFTLSTTMHMSVAIRSTGGSWTTTPLLATTDTYNNKTRSYAVAPNSGPLSIVYNDNLFTSGAVSTASRVHILSRGAEYGRTSLHETTVDVTNANSPGTFGGLSRVAYDISSNTKTYRDAYGALFSAGQTSGSSTDGVMVAVASRGVLYFGEYGGGTGSWFTPISSQSQVAVGSWPTAINNTRKYYGSGAYEGDLRFIGIVAGPDRVAFQCSREYSGRQVIIPVHAKLDRNDSGYGSTVRWHTGSRTDYKPTGTAFDNTAWLISTMYDGVNRNFSFAGSGVERVGRMTFFCLHWLYYGGETFHPYYGVTRKPATLTETYESGGLLFPAQLGTVDTSEPTPTAKDGTGSYAYPYLDRSAGFEFASDDAFTAVVAEAPESFVDANSTWAATFEATGPAEPRLVQGTVYGRYRTVDVHGLPSDWAPLTPTPPNDGTIYTEFSVSHPPIATPTSPTGLAPVSSAIPAPLLAWQFHDTWTADEQTAYQVIVEKKVGAVGIIDTGKVTSSSKSYAASGMTGNSDIKRWKVRIWDLDDVVGAYSDWAEFYYVIPPAINSLTVDATTPLPQFDWTYDTGTGYGGPVKYLVWVFDADQTLIYSSPYIESTSTTESFTVPDPILDIDQHYKVLVITWDTLNSSGTSALVDFDTTAWTRPATVTGVTASDALLASDGYMQITWSTTGQDADFLYYNVYRYTDSDPTLELVGSTTLGSPTSTITLIDALPPLVGTVTYVVKQAVDFYGVTIESLAGSATPVSMDSEYYWLVDPAVQGIPVGDVPTDGLSLVRLWHVTADSFTDEYEESVISLIGRGRKKEVGTRYGYTGTLTLALRGVGGDDPREERLNLEQVRALKDEMWFRNPFGDVFLVTLGTPSYEREAGTGMLERTIVTLPYEEVV